jgi:hypothetical protein
VRSDGPITRARARAIARATASIVARTLACHGVPTSEPAFTCLVSIGTLPTSDHVDHATDVLEPSHLTVPLEVRARHGASTTVYIGNDSDPSVPTPPASLPTLPASLSTLTPSLTTPYSLVNDPSCLDTDLDSGTCSPRLARRRLAVPRPTRVMASQSRVTFVPGLVRGTLILFTCFSIFPFLDSLVMFYAILSIWVVGPRLHPWPKSISCLSSRVLCLPL